MNRRQERQSRPAKRHLSELQKAVMKWLYSDGRRQRRMGNAAEVSFPALVKAMATDMVMIADAPKRDYVLGPLVAEVHFDHQVGASGQHGQSRLVGECLNRLGQIVGADDVHGGSPLRMAVAAAMAGSRS